MSCRNESFILYSKYFTWFNYECAQWSVVDRIHCKVDLFCDLCWLKII